MDKIADMLVTIKNGGRANKEHVHVPYSGYKTTIARALFQEGYIKAYTQKDTKRGSVLEIDILYDQKTRQPRISHLKRVSKPSCRIYTASKNIPHVKQGQGTVFISTPKGILTGEQAKKEMVGGEILFEIA
jgi:small subunit ribosomal protein S8